METNQTALLHKKIPFSLLLSWVRLRERDWEAEKESERVNNVAHVI